MKTKIYAVIMFAVSIALIKFAPGMDNGAIVPFIMGVMFMKG